MIDPATKSSGLLCLLARHMLNRAKCRIWPLHMQGHCLAEHKMIIRCSHPGEDYMAYNRRRWGSDGWTRCALSNCAVFGQPRDSCSADVPASEADFQVAHAYKNHTEHVQLGQPALRQAAGMLEIVASAALRVPAMSLQGTEGFRTARWVSLCQLADMAEHPAGMSSQALRPC